MLQNFYFIGDGLLLNIQFIFGEQNYFSPWKETKKQKNQRVIKCFSDLEISSYNLWQYITEIIQAVYTISNI